MEVVHQAEDPSAPVGSSLAETSPNRGTLTATGGIAADTIMSQLAFLGSKPSRLERAVGEGEETEDGDADGDGTLDDEEPTFPISDKFKFGDGSPYHCQPARPWTLSSFAKIGAAMRPEKELAIILPV